MMRRRPFLLGARRSCWRPSPLERAGRIDGLLAPSFAALFVTAFGCSDDGSDGSTGADGGAANSGGSAARGGMGATGVGGTGFGFDGGPGSSGSGSLDPDAACATGAEQAKLVD